MNSSDSIMRMKFRYIRWVGEGDRRDGWSDGKQAGGGGVATVYMGRWKKLNHEYFVLGSITTTINTMEKLQPHNLANCV